MVASVAQGCIEKAIEYNKALLQIPVVTRASFTPDSTNLVIETSHRSISQLSKRSATQTISLDLATASPITFLSSEVVHSSPAPDGRTAAHFREIKGGETVKRVIEIWNVLEGRLLEELDVSKDHGSWYFDGTFGGVSWHPSSSSLVYTAEGIPPPSVSKFDYTPDFGERFEGKRFPSIFLLLLANSASHVAGEPTEETGRVHQLTGPGRTSPTISFGQAVFIPVYPRTTENAERFRILATGYSSLPDERKLGIVYCMNRPSAIYELTLKITTSPTSDPSTPSIPGWACVESVQQSPVGFSCRCPRVFSPRTGSFPPLVVFLASPENGPHQSCTALYVAQPSQGNLVELVPIVNTAPAKDFDFPGLFVEQLAKEPFLLVNGGREPAVVLSTIWRSRSVPVLISLKTGVVTSLMPWPTRNDNDVVLPYLGEGPKAQLRSLTILGTDGEGRIVGVRSSSISPEEVVVMDMKSGNGSDWKVVKQSVLSPELSKALASLDWTVLPLPKFEPTEIILISPLPIDPAAESRTNLPPLITVPHGGPHSTFTTTFWAQYAALALAGYRIALVNYPGSLGFGQDAIDVLAPQLGTLDVQATLAASHYLNTLSLSSRTKGKNLLMGGSHGGYIAAHLSGQYPLSYDAVVLRNPVVDLPSNFFGTDIPDWVLNEAAPSPTSFYSYKSPPQTLSPALYAHLHKISPLTKASEVVVPTLVMIGLDDRRVPNDQGRAWYHAVKKNGKGQVAMCTFEGNGHGLVDTVEAEIGNFDEGVKWLGKWTEF